jgi:hypothetical protein
MVAAFVVTPLDRKLAHGIVVPLMMGAGTYV